MWGIKVTIRHWENSSILLNNGMYLRKMILNSDYKICIHSYLLELYKSSKFVWRVYTCLFGGGGGGGGGEEGVRLFACHHLSCQSSLYRHVNLWTGRFLTIRHKYTLTNTQSFLLTYRSPSIYTSDIFCISGKLISQYFTLWSSTLMREVKRDDPRVSKSLSKHKWQIPVSNEYLINRLLPALRALHTFAYSC